MMIGDTQDNVLRRKMVTNQTEGARALLVAMIGTAAQDALGASRQQKLDALHFFVSDWYRHCLGHLDLDESLLPTGVKAQISCLGEREIRQRWQDCRQARLKTSMKRKAYDMMKETEKEHKKSKQPKKARMTLATRYGSDKERIVNLLSHKVSGRLITEDLGYGSVSSLNKFVKENGLDNTATRMAVTRQGANSV